MAFNFSQAVQQPAAPSFGAPAANTSALGGGFTFGQPSSAPQQQQQQPSLFGSPAQPAAASTGLFGSSPAQPKPLFGTTPQGSTQPTSLFGAPAAQTQAPSLFGSPAATTTPAVPAFAAPSFGTTPTTQATSTVPIINFGQPTPAPTTAAPAFSFGTAPQTTTTLGQPAAAPTAAAPAFSFGTAPTTTTAPLGFGFGSAAVTAPTTTTTAAVQPQPAAPLFGFGSGSTSAVPTSTTTPGLNFGFGSNLSASTAATSTAPPITSLGGLLGAPTTLQTSAGATFVGLGGISIPSTTSSSLGYTSGTTTHGKGDTRTVGKEAIIPIELTQLADELKQHMRAEKIILSEISRRPDIPVDKVSQLNEDLKNAVNNVTRLVHHQTNSYDSYAKEMKQVQKDLETTIEYNEMPPHLRRELIDTTPFYERLLERYTRQLKFFEREAARVIEVYRSGCDPDEISAKELFATLQSTNDTVLALAARVHSYHESVTDEITAFRNLQRMILGESKFVEEVPATASTLNDIYNRMYEKANVYFSPNIEPSGMTSFLHNQTSPTKGASSPTALTSTPIFARHAAFASKLKENTTFNYGGGYGSPPSLFQTQSSAILNSQLQMTSPQGQANTSLKRSKR